MQNSFETRLSHGVETEPKSEDNAKDNYIYYYTERHGSRFDIPHGEFEMEDEIDQIVERLYKEGNIIEGN